MNLRVSGIFAESFVFLREYPSLLVLSAIPVLSTIFIIQAYLPFSQKDVHGVWILLVFFILFLFAFFLTALRSLSLIIQESDDTRKGNYMGIIRLLAKILFKTAFLSFFPLLLFFIILVLLLFLLSVSDTMLSSILVMLLILLVMIVFGFHQKLLDFYSVFIIVYDMKWKEALIQSWKIHWKWFFFVFLFGEGAIEEGYIAACFLVTGIILFFIPHIGKILVVGIVIIYLTYYEILVSKFIIKVRKNDLS